MLVNQWLEHSAQQYPDKTALVFEGTRLTYREIDQQANQLAHSLIAGGVQPGDRVIIFLENSIEAVIAIFGALKAGAVFCIVNPTTKTDKLTYMLQHTRPAALMTHSTKLNVALPAVEQAPSVQQIIVAGVMPEFEGARGNLQHWAAVLAAQPVTQPVAHSIDVDLAAIVFTSGSTGNPKGVMCPHLSMITVANSIAEYLENDADDIILNVLQFAGSYGLYQLLVAFKVGATLVLERGFAFPYQAIALMQREGVTGLAAVPTIFSMLLSLRDLHTHALPALRYITNAGAALPVSRLQQLRTAFPQARLYSMYGQTECARVCYLAPEDIELRPGSVGKAIPNTQACIVDEHNRPVGPNVVGELVVRGAHIMRGYWEAPEQTAARFRTVPFATSGKQPALGLPGETLLYTNDLFRMDQDGFLYFVGRTDDIIKSRGEKVAPKEIEHALYLFEGVQDAVALGVPDDVLGQAIKVCVAPAPGVILNERALREHCRRHLEDYMWPKYIEIWPDLPKGGTGKIDKHALLAGPPLASVAA